MSNASRPIRAARRAARLQQEAQNCLDVAVRARDEALAADLIDEAARLRARSRELEDAG